MDIRMVIIGPPMIIVLKLSYFVFDAIPTSQAFKPLSIHADSEFRYYGFEKF